MTQRKLRIWIGHQIHLKVFKDFKLLNVTRSKIFDIYEQEFLRNLEAQATNLPNRYKKHGQYEVSGRSGCN